MYYNVIVMGSINMDMFVYINKFPELGDNVVAKSSEVHIGGKGSNQAICVARQGIKHTFIGAVGNDTSGVQMVDLLENYGVDTKHIIKKEDAQTGTCVALIDNAGSNTPIGILGANMALTAQETENAFNDLDGGVLLLQMETSKESIMTALKIAKRKEMHIILDPAPEGLFFKEALAYADLVTPNKNETETIVGFKINSLDDAVNAAKTIAAFGVKNVIVKLGDKGSVVYESEKDKFTYIEAMKVDPINTIGAGDTFAGVLASILSEKKIGLIEAVRIATKASALKISRAGGPDAIPSRKELGY